MKARAQIHRVSTCRVCFSAALRTISFAVPSSSTVVLTLTVYSMRISAFRLAQSNRPCYGINRYNNNLRSNILGAGEREDRKRLIHHWQNTTISCTGHTLHTELVTEVIPCLADDIHTFMARLVWTSNQSFLSY